MDSAPNHRAFGEAVGVNEGVQEGIQLAGSRKKRLSTDSPCCSTPVDVMFVLRFGMA